VPMYKSREVGQISE